jgi:hypothetical protein
MDQDVFKPERRYPRQVVIIDWVTLRAQRLHRLLQVPARSCAR